MSKTFVIVGAGQAGAWVAKTLRSAGFDGRIMLFGAEPQTPYERPPLSKGVLSGACEVSTATLLSADDIAALDIDHRASTVVVNIDRDTKTVMCADGESVQYDSLFLTTGSRPRTIDLDPGVMESGRLHLLRTMHDAQRLRAALAGSRRLAVIGGGWIGLEVAATARELGLEVVVIEAAARLCARSVPGDVSDYLAHLHRGRGNEILINSSVDRIEATNNDITLSLGPDRRSFDQVLLCIGIIPETRLAERAGLSLDNGISVDEFGRTSDPAIFAAGDVASHPSSFAGGRIRLESWANAQNQAIVAAKTALGMDVRYDEIPWIWSDQFDRNLQIIGMPDRAVSIYVRGNPWQHSGCWLALDANGSAVGGIAVNSPRDLRIVRKAMEQRSTPQVEQWLNNDVPAAAIELVPNVSGRLKEVVADGAPR